jgi:hypothetical protein
VFNRRNILIALAGFVPALAVGLNVAQAQSTLFSLMSPVRVAVNSVSSALLLSCSVTFQLVKKFYCWKPDGVTGS